MNDLPKLPAGFELEGGQQGLPPLPPGFMLAPPVSVGEDVAKSVGVAPVKGLASGLGSLGDVTEYGARGLDVATRYIGNKLGVDIPERPNQEPFGGSAQVQRGMESVTGPLYQPQTRAGKLASAPVEMLANPLSYVGPGSALLKMGAAALSGLGSEAAGQATEGTAAEVPARIAGGLAGGIGAVKALGAAPERIAAPTEAALRADKTARYKDVAKSDIEISGNGLGLEAYKWKRELEGPNYAFTALKGDAPRTFALLDTLSRMPPEAIVTAPNLQTIGKQINRITQETKDFKPTPDAAAAMALKERFNKYIENPYPTDVLGGDAKSYASKIKEANKANVAYRNTQRINRGSEIAGDNYEGSIASRLDNQLKTQVTKPLLRDITRGKANSLSEEQKALVKEANKGDIITRVAAELGRGHSVPMLGANALYGLATGGAHLPAQLAFGLGAFGARKLAERRTLANIQKLADAMATDSPLYRELTRGLLPTDLSGNTAALLRGGLLGGLR